MEYILNVNIKNKPKDLNISEYLLLLSIPNLKYEDLSEISILEKLENLDYIRVLESEIVLNKKSLTLIEKDYNNTITEVLLYFNQLLELKKNAGINNKSSRSFTKARLLEGFCKDDLIGVINHKFNEWRNDPYWKKFIRVSTLFNSEKFPGYYADWKTSQNDEDNIERM